MTVKKLLNKTEEQRDFWLNFYRKTVNEEKKDIYWEMYEEKERFISWIKTLLEEEKEERKLKKRKIKE